MALFVLREGSHDPGTAFTKFRAAAAAGANLVYAEIVRLDPHVRGAALHCALFNHELGDNARVIAVVHDGNVMMLNQKLAAQTTFACPQGHVRGVVAPAGASLRCGACSAPLTSGQSSG